MKEVETAIPIVVTDATRTGCLRKYIFFLYIWVWFISVSQNVCITETKKQNIYIF